nr:uncharacterized protein CI109_000484 [Kwoniella shandongensis]KAA5530913.1 hypothetical protein CI109_000484 [Kwoniella shandongensis]
MSSTRSSKASTTPASSDHLSITPMEQPVVSGAFHVDAFWVRTVQTSSKSLADQTQVFSGPCSANVMGIAATGGDASHNPSPDTPCVTPPKKIRQ